MASYKIDELLARLEIKAKRVGRFYAGPCPVHGGDRANAFNLYPDGYAVRGMWTCRTQQCQKHFRRTLVGLTRGVLSHQRLGWRPEEPGARVAPLKDAIAFLCDLVGQKWADLRSDVVASEKRSFVSTMAMLGRAPQVRGEGWEPRDIVSRLQCPSPYFIGRGLPADVLGRYSVGDAKTGDAKSPMFKRAVVPVFDDDGRLVVGCTGRSTWPQCAKCSSYHAPQGACPAGEALYYPSVAKWRNTDNFARERHLYNFWCAKQHIKATGEVILVEGPPDALACIAAGHENVVALMGTDLTDAQQILLERSGAMRVTSLLDADSAGAAATAELADKLVYAFRFRAPPMPFKQAAGSDPAALKQFLDSLR